jgi:predicted MFS family arabinose efflux permease
MTAHPSMPVSTGPHPAQASRSRDVRPLAVLAIANGLSLSGNVIVTVAIPWLVLDRTGSVTLAGLSVASAAVAAALGALVAGRFVDLAGATRTSATADLLSAAALVPIPLLESAGVLELWHLVGLVFVGTLVDAAGSTARQGLVPLVADGGAVGRERANSVFTGTEHVGYLLGAPAAGLLIATIGAAGAIWIDAATFILSGLLVLTFVRLRKHASPEAGTVAAARVASPHRSTLADAIRLVRRDPALRALVVIPTLATLLIGPLVPILLPVLAREVYRDPVALGVLVAAYGVGGLAGTVGFGLVGRRARRRRLYLSLFVAWPLIYAILAAGAPLLLAATAVGALGAAAGALVPLQATIRQERTPPALLPRVVGLSTGTVPVVAPIAVLVSGVAIDALGITATIALMVAAIVALGAGVALSEGVRRFDDTAGQRAASAEGRAGRVTVDRAGGPGSSPADASARA